MQLNVISSLALSLGLGYGSVAAAEEVRNIAIIGAGAAGSSTAYHLHRYASQEGLPVNVTIFEKTSHVGGRTLTVNAWGSPNEPIELGASIFVEMNEILYNATKAFKLPLGGKPHAAEEESSTLGQDTTAIWDGENIVYQSDRDGSWWWDAAKLWWKYGMAPYKAVKLVKEVVGQFLQLYEEPWFPFRSLTQRAFELGLEKVTAVTGEQFLDQKGINPEFSREIIQAATRVNYASNLAYIHGLEAMVSFATDGAVSIFGGNWQIFDNMVKASNSILLRQTKVSSITLADKDGPDSPPKYRLKTKHVKTEDSSDEEYPIVFDNVVIASPWQFSDIDADTDVIQHKIDEIPYMKLHVTLFTSPYRLRSGFFGLDPGTQAPSTVYTTLGKDETPQQGADGVGRSGFYSISKLRTAVNPETRRLEFVYKIFSPKEVTSEFLTDILGAAVPSTFTATTTGGEGTDGVSPISWYYPHWFYSYPVELPRVTFQDPILGDGLYYTSGIESFISTMETSALMGMNVARLIADDAAGVTRGNAILEEEDDDDATLRGKVVGDEL